MRYLVLVLALSGFMMSGCTNTATGFGKDLEKSGQAIQKTVAPKSQQPANINAAGARTAGESYDAQRYDQQQAPPQTAPTPLINNNNTTYTPTPSGY